MADPAPLIDADPTRIGEYTLLGRLGQGGQGVVYLGTGPDGAQVAVKTLHGDALDLPGLRAQLAEEVEMARRVARFCTAQVLAADLESDPPYVVSEYVEGQSLQAVVRQQGALDGAVLERLAVGTLTALAAIHQAGIVHRDFKPGNVLMAPGGPRVIDFGIARALEGTAILTSRIAGTPAYMAPEQITGGPLGPAVDLFAWGATIVYAANGRGPFGHDSLKAVVNRVVNDDPDLGELNGPLREIAERCLDKDASRRPTAAEALMLVLGVENAPPPDEPTTDTAVPVAHQTLVAGAIAAADTGAQESAAAEIYRSYPPVNPSPPGPGAVPPPVQPPPVAPPGPPYPTGGQQRLPYPYPTGPQRPGYPGAPYPNPPVPSGPGQPYQPPARPHWTPPTGPHPGQPVPPQPQYPGRPPYGQQPANGTSTGVVIGVIGAVVVAGLLVFVLVIAAISNLG
ncbi:serine/threonine protein kinase [Thermobifida halotolerans]|uniref:Serine/threonine protein kinase n=1 Tax=Thermobifida halotolerans TaxID=483545 RepID=A0A399FZN2_9ACTN|nr:serine/threonine-protein kinase [Thermobifida halotolerans]UOE19578.1 serine/threonine protein kinase [Thermobifida halotolerans]